MCISDISCPIGRLQDRNLQGYDAVLVRSLLPAFWRNSLPSSSVWCKTSDDYPEDGGSKLLRNVCNKLLISWA
jgi:hypothetical protein